MYLVSAFLPDRVGRPWNASLSGRCPAVHRDIPGRLSGVSTRLIFDPALCLSSGKGVQEMLFPNLQPGSPAIIGNQSVVVRQFQVANLAVFLYPPMRG
jgi:hypothetical protein